MNTLKFPREDKMVKVSVLMPPDMLAALRVAGFQRGTLEDGSIAVSQLVREAVSEWLQREIDRASVIAVRL